MLYIKSADETPTFTSLIQAISDNNVATLSNISTLSTITISTSDDGIIKPVREEPYNYTFNHSILFNTSI